MNQNIRLRWIIWLTAGMAAASGLWMGFEIWRGGHAHYGLFRDTPDETIVIGPGRAVVAYYLFIIFLSLLPAAWLLLKAIKERRAIPAIACAVSIAATSLISGFVYETLQSEIRLTLVTLNYRAGSTRVNIAWNEIQAIAVRTYSRSQWLEVLSNEDLLRIDLAPYSLRDKQLLVSELPRIARLGSIPRKLPDGWVWRRSGGITLPQ